MKKKREGNKLDRLKRMHRQRALLAVIAYNVEAKPAPYIRRGLLRTAEMLRSASEPAASGNGSEEANATKM